ncbi:MAG: 23S rRNA (guanosine(2251)-2'-O)-methyltransferase RlmB [Gammaproteobacteria bacterium]
MAPPELLIGGLHAVRTALLRAPSDCLELWLSGQRNDAGIEEIAALAERAGTSVARCDARTLARRYGDEHHQGAVLRRRPPAPVGLNALLETLAASSAPPLLLVLDAVQDPRNFGACLRAADGAGADAVVYPRDKSARLGNVLAKAASGAIDTVRLTPVPNLAAAMRALRDAGIWITGTDGDAATTLYEVDFSGPAALVLGNEGSGLRRLTREHCDTLAAIPMAGGLESLNVATAAAVCLYEARRQRL